MGKQAKQAQVDVTDNENLGWQLSGLMAGMIASTLTVIACFGAAIAFSGSAAEGSGEERTTVAR